MKLNIEGFEQIRLSGSVCSDVYLHVQFFCDRQSQGDDQRAVPSYIGIL